MLRLHDRTRRRIALAIFFSLGLMPTLAVSAWGVWWRSSRHIAREAEQLGWRLGMIVSLAGVRHPEPGVVVYECLQVCEPEGGQPVFRCREARVSWSASLDDRRTPGMRVILSQPEVNALQWGEVWGLVDRLLRRRTEVGDAAWHVSAEELGIVGRELSDKLFQVEARLDARPEGPHLETAFRLAGKTDSEPVRLLVARNRQRTPAATGLVLDTGGVPVPCRLLAIGLPGFGLLGPRSSFCGTLQAIPSGDGPSGEIAGQFTEVDLERLVSDHSAHRMSGMADLSVETGRFARGRLEEAVGSLVGGPGMVGRSLLELAIQRLGMAGGIGIDRADPVVPYEQLTVWFALDAGGLRVRGLSPTGASGTMLAGRTGAILREPQPPAAPLPLATLVQALVPEAEMLVPIARKTDWLLPRLPSARPSGRTDVENPLRYGPGGEAPP